MCLDKVFVTGKQDSFTVVTFEGFKLFRFDDGVIKNSNTGKIEFEFDRWYQANIFGDEKVGSEQNQYLMGYHIFHSKEAVIKYKKQINHENSSIFKVQFRDILTIGEQFGEQCVTARYMFIPSIGNSVLTISDLKAKDRFKILEGNYRHNFVLLDLHHDLKVVEDEKIHKYVYMNETTHRVYANDKNLKVAKL